MPYIGNITQDFNVNNAMLDTDSVTSIKIVDGTIEGADIAANLDLSDTQKIRLGAGNDLQIYHDGSNSYVADVGTGNMNINGSAVQILNPSATEVLAKFIQNAAVELYYDNDRKLRTVSSGCQVESTTGDAFLVVRSEEDNANSDAFIRLQVENTSATSGVLFGDSDDGDIGRILYEHADNSMRFTTNTATQWKITSTGHLENNNDTGRIKLGTSDDLQLFHDATNSVISNSTGTLFIAGDIVSLTNAAISETYIKGTANGSVELYHNNVKTFETDGNGIFAKGPEGGSANVYIYADEGDDDADKWSLRSDPSNSEFTINNRLSGGFEKNIQCHGNGNVELFYDASKKFETTSSGATVSGELTVTSNLLMGDGDKLRLGDSNDLELHHSGGENYIQGHLNQLYIRSAQGIYIQPNTNENGVVALANQGVKLYYDNSEKIETRPTGLRMQNSSTLEVNGGLIKFGHCSSAGTDDTLMFGSNGDDLKIFHGGNSQFDNNTGHLEIRNIGDFSSTREIRIRARVDENYLNLYSDGAVKLYYDSSLKFETDSAGTTTSGRAYITGTILQGTTDSGESNGDEATFANTGGNAGITIRSAVDAECKIYFSEGTSGGAQYRGAINYNHNTNYMAFSANETEKFRIDSSGNKYLDNTFDTAANNQRKSYFTNTGQQFHARNAHEAYIVFQDVSGNNIGNITRGSGASIAFNTSSDYRLKENVVTLSDAITRLKTLSPKRFNFKSDPSITMDGFLAHEVTAVPEAIEGEKDGVITQAMLDAGTLEGTVGDPIYQGIDQSKLVPLLVAALQEEISNREALEARVVALEAA